MKPIVNMIPHHSMQLTKSHTLGHQIKYIRFHSPGLCQETLDALHLTMAILHLLGTEGLLRLRFHIALRNKHFLGLRELHKNRRGVCQTVCCAVASHWPATTLKPPTDNMNDIVYGFSSVFSGSCQTFTCGVLRLPLSIAPLELVFVAQQHILSCRGTTNSSRVCQSYGGCAWFTHLGGGFV